MILLLTHSRDHYTVDLVGQALTARGAAWHRLDTDRFPTSLRLSSRLSNLGARHRLGAPAEALDVSEVTAVWMRRVWPAALDDELDERFREACRRESAAALDGVFDALDARRGVLWINDPDATRAAGNKLRQLRFAREAGLDVPDTLVTNDPDEVRKFHLAHGGNVVAKLQRSLSTSMDKAPAVVRTSIVREEDLAHLDQLRHAPMTFQERIPKSVELRVVCVGTRQFVGSIDASDSEHGAVDWRAAAPGEARWTVGELPPEAARALDALRHRLGLVYGAADLVLTPDGRVVFLELNSGGEWGMLQRDAGLHIAEALAEELTGGLA